ncbi:MAG: hypothetical protein BWY83_01379 [bacterium ADurb.Bin478]|nr:MAG: hypothetical protein BWY83_01379 [bacterium ADurb.Bin478]
MPPAPERPNRSLKDFTAELIHGRCHSQVSHGNAKRFERVLQHGGRIQVEGALFVPLLSVGDVIDPDRRDAQIFYRQQALLRPNAFEIVVEAEQARKRLLQSGKIAGVQVMIIAVKIKTDAVIQNRSPSGEMELPFHQPRQAVVGRPAVEEIAVQRDALTVGGEITRGQRCFAKGPLHRMELMAAIAAVLLAFARHAVHHRFVAAVVQRVHRCVEQLLQRRLRAADSGLMRPGIDATANMQIRNLHRPLNAVDMQLQPTQALVIKSLKMIDPLLADKARPRIEMAVDQHRTTQLMRLMHQQLHHGAGRSLQSKAGPADHLFAEFKGQRDAACAVAADLPAALLRLLHLRPSADAKSVRCDEFEIVLNRTLPFQSVLFAQPLHSDLFFPHQGDRPFAQLRLFAPCTADIQHIFFIQSGQRRLIRPALKRHGRHPQLIH